MADGKDANDKLVKIVSKSNEHVALELMKIIAEKEWSHNNDVQQLKRFYWLNLYKECLDVVNGAEPKPTE